MKRVAAACSFALPGVLWTAAAAAHPGYPMVVETTLGLSAVFDPSGNNGGCYLCHQTTAGGTALRPFGTLLVQQYGLSSDPVNEDDSSLMAALEALKAGPDAKLAADIEAGVDPNDDPLIDEVANPTPEYGCSVGAPAAGGSAPWVVGVALGLALAGAAVRKRRR
jgi:MYXO-CTERM domain-containing protein